jgi:ribokinase
VKTPILVVGSINTDLVISTSRLPSPGETILGDDFIIVPGGKGANQAVAAARLGGDVSLLARVGKDPFGQQAINSLLQERINTHYMIQDPQAPSGIAMIMIGPDGQNIIAVAPGANSKLTVDDIHAASAAFSQAHIILLQLEIPLLTVREAVRMGKSTQSIVILNSAPAQPLSPELLSQVNILTPNEAEAKSLTGASTPDEAAGSLLERGVKTVIITLGEKGVLMADREHPIQHLPGFRVTAVDATAAGDAFNGGLAVALAHGEAIETAIRFAQAAAAISVTRRGAQTSLPSASEVRSFLRTH